MSSPTEQPNFSVRYHVPGSEPKTVQLSSQPLVVGSANNADIQLSKPSISRRHFLISQRDNHIYITDLSSRNGTYLKGLRLPANLEHEWTPGDALRITDIQFELTTRQPDTKRESVSFSLNAAPTRIGVNQPIQLQVTYQGSQELAITLQAQPLRPGFSAAIVPNGGTLRPGESFKAEARIQQTNSFWFGAEGRVRFSAVSTTNQLDTAEVIVRARFRYEMLLLLLLLLIPPVAASVLAAIPSPTTPTPIVFVETDTAVPSSTFTSTPTPSATTTSTVTPSPTLPPPICIKQCPSGWQNYIVQPGDTLFSLALAAQQPMSVIQSVNCIAAPDNLQAGSSICLPSIFVPTEKPLQTTDCTGFKPTSPLNNFPQHAVDFYWDAPTNFIPDSYHLDIYSTDNNQLLISRDVFGATTTNVDVSWQALGIHIRYLWRIQAVWNGQVVCSADVPAQIDWPPTDPLQATDPPPPDPTPYVDLIVSSIDLVSTPQWDDDCTYVSLSVNYTVHNNGNRTSGTFASQAALYDDDSFIDSYNTQCGFSDPSCPETTLGPGRSASFSFDTTYSPAGVFGDNLYVIARADVETNGEGGAQTCSGEDYCNVRERIEDNNSFTRTIPIPDCTIVTPEVIPDPGPSSEVTIEPEPTLEVTPDPEPPAETPDPGPLPDLVVNDLTIRYRQDCDGGFFATYSYVVSNIGEGAASSYFVAESYSFRYGSIAQNISNNPVIENTVLESNGNQQFSDTVTLDEYQDGRVDGTIVVTVFVDGDAPDADPTNNQVKVTAATDNFPGC